MGLPATVVALLGVVTPMALGYGVDQLIHPGESWMAHAFVGGRDLCCRRVHGRGNDDGHAAASAVVVASRRPPGDADPARIDLTVTARAAQVRAGRRSSRQATTPTVATVSGITKKSMARLKAGSASCRSACRTTKRR